MSGLGKLTWKHRARRILYTLRNRPTIKSADAVIGKNVVFGKNVKIVASHLRIGDGCIIGDNVQITCQSFEMGDYGVIYHGCFFPGGTVKIGHNFWLGTGSVVDGRAGTTIGNNVGIGAQSQLWTHMSFGDILQGCRFRSERPLLIGDNVWLVGHNLVSPVTMGDRSMAMLGSLVTKDLEADRTYAGSPAIDMTDRLGSQFEPISAQEQFKLLEDYLVKFAAKYNLGDYKSYISVLTDSSAVFETGSKLQINLPNRTYQKTGTILEYYLIRHLLPDVKLLPA